MSKEGEAGGEAGGGVRRLKAGDMGGAHSRPRGLSRRRAREAQMLAAVEAVTSMSQWQLALFNAWKVGGYEGGKHS